MNQENNAPLRRVEIIPEVPMEKLKRNEIGIKTSIRGQEIRDYVNRSIHKLITLNMRQITLKAIGNACSKVMSIADILRRKLKDLYQQNNSYSRKYIAKYESEDVHKSRKIINRDKFIKRKNSDYRV